MYTIGLFQSQRSCLSATYFSSTLDSPLVGYDRKTTTLLRNHEYFIPTKIHENPSRGSGQEVENANSWQTTKGMTLKMMDGQTTDWRRTVDCVWSQKWTWAFALCALEVPVAKLGAEKWGGGTNFFPEKQKKKSKQTKRSQRRKSAR